VKPDLPYDLRVTGILGKFETYGAVNNVCKQQSRRLCTSVNEDASTVVLTVVHRMQCFKTILTTDLGSVNGFRGRLDEDAQFLVVTVWTDEAQCTHKASSTLRAHETN
jgi:hypothetical protein